MLFAEFGSPVITALPVRLAGLAALVATSTVASNCATWLELSPASGSEQEMLDDVVLQLQAPGESRLVKVNPAGKFALKAIDWELGSLVEVFVTLYLM